MRTEALTDKTQIDASDFVASVFAALDAAAVSYVLLRGYDELLTSSGFLEIDLLVKPDHLNWLRQTVAELSFVEWPAWGHSPHHFFLAFDSERGDWIKLDVVTELMYGHPVRRFQVDLADACLQQRRSDWVYRLSPLHEFVTLLLHCLLDKGQFRKEHRGRLLELLGSMEIENGKIGPLIEKYTAPVFFWETIRQAAARGDWDSLLAKRRQLARRFFRRQPLSSRWRIVCARVMRLLRGPAFALFRRGISVALLAPDGAGKSTLTTALAHDRILKARGVYMGGNLAASALTLPTTRFLHRRLQAKNGAKSKANKILTGLNFCSKMVEQWLRAAIAHFHLWRGRFVVFDRYIFDSWVNPKPRTLWKRVRRILFEAVLPAPDLVILLDAPGEILFARKGEHTPQWLEEQRRRYLRLKTRLPNLRIIDAALPAEMVRRQAIAMIWKQYQLKHHLKHGNRDARY
jgi:thymidylate kinase